MDSPCIKQTVCKVLKIFQYGKYLVAYVLKGVETSHQNYQAYQHDILEIKKQVGVKFPKQNINASTIHVSVNSTSIMYTCYSAVNKTKTSTHKYCKSPTDKFANIVNLLR